ncbi:MAG: two-component system alkaline phosphatase synthesis response regulator PhoP [Arenicella sp.]|jgi:two-component system alkaline phosphatase synthesis response regulator PhoP
MSKEAQKILLVDDEKDILEILSYNLEKEGFSIKTAENGLKAVEIAKKFKPNLIIIDIMMPIIDGVETCRMLRENKDLDDTFIMFLTARSEEYSEVAAFDIGADDYITKPIKPRALISRINALFRRGAKKGKTVPKDVVEIGKFKVDRTSYTLFIDGKPTSLPKKEFELLYHLAESPNKVFTRDELLLSIWGSDVYVLARTVDVHIRRVREKIGTEHIKTVKGVGYKFVDGKE